MTAQAAPVDSVPPLTPEDQGRAGCYALLARLWYAPPDAALLRAIAAAGAIVAEGEQVGLAEAWRQLQAAAAAAEPPAVALEYDAVFVGTGKAPVTLYLTHYLADGAAARILVALRDELRQLGLARTRSTHEPEDHLAALCEVMRHLIGLGATDAALQRQRQFFTRYLSPAYNSLSEQVFIFEPAHFYKHVARFTRAFFQVELAALDML